MKRIISAVMFVMAFSMSAKAVQCSFSEGSTSYQMEMLLASGGVIMGSRPGAQASTYVVKYTGTGSGGAQAYEDGQGIKLFIMNQDGVLTMRMMDTNQGQFLFQGKTCRNSAEIDTKMVAENVEQAIYSSQEIQSIVRILEQSRGMKCSVNRGLTKVTSQEKQGEGYTYIETGFVASMSCTNTQFAAYAGEVKVSGSFSKNGVELTLGSISINQGGN